MSLWNANSVDPDLVSDADIADVCAELGIDTSTPAGDDFFTPGAVYRRGTHGEQFRCVAAGIHEGRNPVAVGFLPINLGREATWEFAAMTGYEWRRGWTKEEA